MIARAQKGMSRKHEGVWNPYGKYLLLHIIGGGGGGRAGEQRHDDVIIIPVKPRIYLSGGGIHDKRKHVWQLAVAKTCAQLALPAWHGMAEEQQQPNLPAAAQPWQPSLSLPGQLLWPFTSGSVCVMTAQHVICGYGFSGRWFWQPIHGSSDMYMVHEHIMAIYLYNIILILYNGMSILPTQQ